MIYFYLPIALHHVSVFFFKKCKKIAQSQEDDVIVNKPHVSDEEEEEHPFINHPFKLNEPKPIFFNLTVSNVQLQIIC